MKNFLITIFMALNHVFPVFSQSYITQGNLEPGPYPVGFEIVEKVDDSRTCENSQTEEVPGLKVKSGRSIRIYLWYPAETQTPSTMTVMDYLEYAASDFKRPVNSDKDLEMSLPIQLKKGLGDTSLSDLKKERVLASEGVPPRRGQFPLILVGQGLYYESPFTHFVLSEYLASHGYIVATCPLIGTSNRLMNLNIIDLETQVRDLEFIISHTINRPDVDPGPIAMIGYDIGGMAGLILCMRNSRIGVYISLDSGILYPHFSGLPQSHPNYDEQKFNIPWLHITQSRFVPLQTPPRPSLYTRKIFGDSYLMLVRTDNHGAFTSYALTGINNAVPGYWRAVQPNLDTVYEAVCQRSLQFLDTYLRNDTLSGQALNNSVSGMRSSEESLYMEFKKGAMPPPSKETLVNLIINRGMDESVPMIKSYRGTYPDSLLFDETVLNWLGYHFLYWWDREAEAISLFELIAEIFPGSANAYDSLGEAYLVVGKTDLAIRNYQKSLELNPENQNARNVLQSLQE